MSLQIGSSQVPQALFSLAAHCSWELGATVSSSLEAAFYSNLKGGVTEAKKITTWIRTSAIAHIETIQTLFNALNFGVVLFYTAKLVNEVYNTHSWIFNNPITEPWILAATAVMTTLGAGTALGLKILYRYTPELEKPKTDQDIEVKESISFTQFNAYWIQTTKLILICALSIFEQNKLLKVLSFATASYSLYKNMQLKWINVSQDMDLSRYNLSLIRKVRATYNMLVLPFDQKEVENTCPICLNDKVDMTLCAQHTIHRSCAAALAIRRIRDSINDGFFRKTTTEHYHNGIHTHTSHSYSVTIPEENLLKCPTCKDPMLQNSCDLSIIDRVHGTFTARAHIIRKPVDQQPVFENIYALYCSAQAGLAYLQTYPELTAIIFKIQSFMMITDFIGYAVSAYYLYNRVNAKFNPKNKLLVHAALITAFVATAALSYYAIIQVNAYLKSIEALKTILNQLPISSDMLKNLEVNWVKSELHQALQCLYLNRLIASIGLSFFSTQKLQSSAIILWQCASLVGISQLNLIEFIHTIDSPLKIALNSGGKLLNQIKEDSLKSLKLRTTYLFHASVDLKEALQAVCNFSSSLFNKSIWSRSAFPYLLYRVKLQNENFSTLPPFLNSIQMMTSTQRIPFEIPASMSILKAF